MNHLTPRTLGVAAALPCGPLAVLGTVAPSMPDHVDRLTRAAGPAASFDVVVVDLAATLAFASSAWLIGVTVLAILARGLWGRRRRTSSGLAALTPRLWREFVLTVVGVSALSGTALTGTASAGPAAAGPEAASADHDPSGRPVPDLAGLRLPDRPSAGRPGAGRPTAGDRNAARPRRVTVRPGDSLWAIASRRLPAEAAGARIARSCHAWYAANRAVVGPDPDLIYPGMSLHPPPRHGARNERTS